MSSTPTRTRYSPFWSRTPARSSRNPVSTAATGLVSDDIDAALDEIVPEDTITEKRLHRDGESVTYYRLNPVE